MMSGCQRFQADCATACGGETAVTELVAWSLDQAHSIVSRPQKTATSGGKQRTFVS